jgi:lysophospholipase L1-like esterase
MIMKNILCYGDSNTWGLWEKAPNARLEYGRRWPGILQERLGTDYHIIEEGCCGRTTVLEDRFEPGRNGKSVLPTILESHKPLDMVILSLGTNDLKMRFSLTPLDIAMGIGELIKIIQRYPCGKNGKLPEILVVSPIYVSDNIEDTPFGELFGKPSVEKSRLLFSRYQRICSSYGCYCMDAAQFAQASFEDAIHMDAENHLKLALAIEKKIKEII